MAKRKTAPVLDPDSPLTIQKGRAGSTGLAWHVRRGALVIAQAATEEEAILEANAREPTYPHRRKA